VAAPPSVLPSALPAYPGPCSGAGAPAGLPRRVARLLHPPRRRAGRPGRRAAERPGARHVPAAAEPGTGPPARLGQHLCRAGLRPDRRRAAARPAGLPSLGGWATGLCGGRHHLAALRRRVLAPSAAPTTTRQALGRAADHRRLAFQWICQLGFDRDSWTAPADARRLHPLEDTDHTAAAQIRALLGRLPTGGRVPLFVFDAGYDSAQLTLDLADAPVAVLVRLRSDRCFYADPPSRSPRRKRPAAPPRRQVQLRRPDHLADPDHYLDLSGRRVTSAPGRPRPA
jgi:hypothetical protein